MPVHMQHIKSTQDLAYSLFSRTISSTGWKKKDKASVTEGDPSASVAMEQLCTRSRCIVDSMYSVIYDVKHVLYCCTTKSIYLGKHFFSRLL
jgi:hypothetical protein